jgi:hypothetical protein
MKKWRKVPRPQRAASRYIRIMDPGTSQSQSQSQSHISTDGQSVSLSWCRAPAGAHDQIFVTV